MDIKSIFEKINSGEVSAHSELGTRDEAKQTKVFASRIQRLKLGVGIKAHALVMKDVVLPFNPFTGEPDDKYNNDAKFRPILLVSQVLAGIKESCAGNPELAAKWNAHLGASEGEIDWSAPVSMDDYYLFKRADFIKPRVMSFATVALNFKGLEGFSEYRTKYTVDPTELDEGYSYAPEKAPLWHKAAVLFNSMLKPEADEKVQELTNKGASKEQISVGRREVYTKSPVGFVSPSNLIPFIYIPFNEQPKTFDAAKHSDFEGMVRLYGYQPDKWGTAIAEALKDNQLDEDMDFFDFTLRTPDATQTKSDGKVYTDEDSLELYQAMSIAVTDGRSSIWTGTSTIDGASKNNSELYAFVWAAAKDYFLWSQEESFNNGDTFEKLVAASSRFRPITNVMDKFLQACNRVFVDDFASSKYFTDNVKHANHDILIAMNKDNALALADVDDEDLENASKNQQRSLAALMQEARGDIGDGDGSLPLAEMNMEGEGDGE